MDEITYASRMDTLRAYKERNHLGRFDNSISKAGDAPIAPESELAEYALGRKMYGRAGQSTGYAEV